MHSSLSGPMVGLTVLILTSFFGPLNSAAIPQPTVEVPIRFIHIRDRVVPENLHAFIGEEVRWVNLRSAPVRLEITEPDRLEPSCHQGAARPDYSGETGQSAMIPPGRDIGACFMHGGVIRYTVWLEPANPRSRRLTGRVYLDASV
jgi:hypothetical protein